MTIELPNEHYNPEDSQLIIALTGTPEKIREYLQSILAEMYNNNKPRQGTRLQYQCDISVITPIWKGKTY